MTLRLAGPDDIPTVVRMVREFHSQSPFSGMEFDERKVEQTALSMIAGLGVIILALQDDEPVGMIAGALAEPLFSHERMATEAMFWVDPPHRGGPHARELKEAYEYWAERSGCRLIQMSALQNEHLPSITRYYERAGYSPVEHTYLKAI